MPQEVELPPTPRTPRERWLDAGLEALVEGGPDAVRVETLATALGVTKGGFYGYFAGRPALLDELLDEWERRCTDDVLARVEAEGGDARDRLRRAGGLTSSEDLHRLDLAVRQWARRDEAVAARLRRIDAVRLDFLRRMFATFVADPDEVEARSTLMFTLAIGRHFLAADAEAVRRAGEHLLR
ncbi:TetR/AcrR family transcriptional regulator [Saccharothrix violaceirubra]|uniref:AcrR family transcriptional regulator n=1 Tax=Saccharothrix violaceirubra TaxID=413306 RepID=A0A7W7T411_9PSEU|nr:TetR/AcrR family transcriptional regulator [Saccharothrix violaceirubra]MBB4966126.1 AcrR family transcriptional regulator [Saccharothrix violaceirubra]